MKFDANIEAVTFRQSGQLHMKAPFSTSPGAVRGCVLVSNDEELRISEEVRAKRVW